MSPIIQPFGPHTEAVLRFLGKADLLTPAEWRVVAVRYEQAASDRREAAEVASIERLLEHGPRLGEEWTAQERVQAVMQKLRQFAFSDTLGSAVRVRELDTVHVALAYAVTALVARDLIDEATFATLYAPFDELIPLEE